jgi:hypothetical protein
MLKLATRKMDYFRCGFRFFQMSVGPLYFSIMNCIFHWRTLVPVWKMDTRTAFADRKSEPLFSLSDYSG